MTTLNHTVSLTLVAAVRDDRGRRLHNWPLVGLFLWLPAALYLWVAGLTAGSSQANPKPLWVTGQRRRRRLANPKAGLLHNWPADLAYIGLACRALAIRWKYLLAAYVLAPAAVWA